MHPAPSIILFTVLSGFGFGLISIIGLLQFLSVITMFDLIIYSIIGVIFATVGLVSSFFHLANKKNAIKSLSQWQTSWLSREAIASISCLLVVFGNVICKSSYGATILRSPTNGFNPRWYRPSTVPVCSRIHCCYRVCNHRI